MLEWLQHHGDVRHVRVTAAVALGVEANAQMARTWRGPHESTSGFKSFAFLRLLWRVVRSTGHRCSLRARLLAQAGVAVHEGATRPSSYSIQAHASEHACGHVRPAEHVEGGQREGRLKRTLADAEYQLVEGAALDLII
eukprot:2640013-Prymnesium_polylepis.1